MCGGPVGWDLHLAAFIGALRSSGHAVGVSAAVDAARVLTLVDLLDREQLRHGLGAVLVSSAAERPAFDILFDVWWPRSNGPDGAAGGPGGGSPAGRVDPGDDLSVTRQELVRVLLTDDEAELRRVAREAVGRFGTGRAGAAGAAYSAYRTMQALDPGSLVARLLAGLLSGQQDGAGAGHWAQAEVARRLGALRTEVEADVRRRTALERGPAAAVRGTLPPRLDQIDFLRAQSGDLAELRRTIAPLAARLATRMSARRRSARSGRLDFRRTVRASLATGGVPVVTHHRPPTVHKPQLVVLCDVSGSVAGFSHFTLMLTQALRNHFTGVRAFAFVDTTDEVTRYFTPGGDVVDAVRRIGREAAVSELDGHSDYGNALLTFRDRWADAVGPRTTLLVLGDARSNHRPPRVDVLHELVGRAKRAYWLNPEPRHAWGDGDSVADSYREVLSMAECRNVVQLADAVSSW